MILRCDKCPYRAEDNQPGPPPERCTCGRSSYVVSGGRLRSAQGFAILICEDLPDVSAAKMASKDVTVRVVTIADDDVADDVNNEKEMTIQCDECQETITLSHRSHLKQCSCRRVNWQFSGGEMMWITGKFTHISGPDLTKQKDDNKPLIEPEKDGPEVEYMSMDEANEALYGGHYPGPAVGGYSIKMNTPSNTEYTRILGPMVEECIAPETA